MLPVCQGGEIKHPVRKVLEAVHVADFLNMARINTDQVEIWPFPLRFSSSVNRVDPNSPSQEEKHDEAFVDALNSWLGAIGYQLSEEAEQWALTMIGEILDNARRHSDPETGQGIWAMAGFMARRPQQFEHGKQRKVHICNIAIFSFGASIYETLQGSSPEMWGKIDRYAKQHSKKTDISPETLWTVAALQDGVTRLPPTAMKGGIGMMELIEMMNELGSSAPGIAPPKMTIVSGSSCLQISDPYRQPTRSPTNHRVLPFNTAQSLDSPPENTHVYDLPCRIPGTIVSVRFTLDEDDLQRQSEAEKGS